VSFLAIKQNPFDDYGDAWTGVGKRAQQAATAAAEAASEVLVETLQERGEKLPGFDEETLRSIEHGPDKSGVWRVGIPAHSPLAEKAFQAEYGTDDEPPTGLMRSSERKARQAAEEVFTDTLHDELFGG
jgi:hypothetical protein